MKRRAPVALSAAATLLVGGCSSTADTAVAPSSAPHSPTESPSTPSKNATTVQTSPAPPEVRFDPIPEAARQHTNEGAIAFALFFVDQSHKGLAEPHAGILARLCKPTSKMCASMESEIASYEKNSWHADRPIGVVHGQRLVSSPDPEVTAVLVQYEIASFNIVDSSGSVQKSSQGKYFPLEFRLTWQNDGWLVDSIATTRS